MGMVLVESGKWREKNEWRDSVTYSRVDRLWAQKN